MKVGRMVGLESVMVRCDLSFEKENFVFWIYKFEFGLGGVVFI